MTKLDWERNLAASRRTRPDGKPAAPPVPLIAGGQGRDDDEARSGAVIAYMFVLAVLAILAVNAAWNW